MANFSSLNDRHILQSVDIRQFAKRFSMILNLPDCWSSTASKVALQMEANFPSAGCIVIGANYLQVIQNHCGELLVHPLGLFLPRFFYCFQEYSPCSLQLLVIAPPGLVTFLSCSRAMWGRLELVQR